MLHKREPKIAWALETTLKATVWSIYWNKAHMPNGELTGDVLWSQKPKKKKKSWAAQNPHLSMPQKKITVICKRWCLWFPREGNTAEHLVCCYTTVVVAAAMVWEKKTKKKNCRNNSNHLVRQPPLLSTTGETSACLHRSQKSQVLNAYWKSHKPESIEYQI